MSGLVALDAPRLKYAIGAPIYGCTVIITTSGGTNVAGVSPMGDGTLGDALK